MGRLSFWRGGDFRVMSFPFNEKKSPPGDWRFSGGFSSKPRAQLVRGEQAQRRVTRRLALDEAISRRLAGTLAAGVDQGEVLELDEVGQPSPHRRVRLLELLADLTAGDDAVPVLTEAGDARERPLQRRLEIGQGIDEQLADEAEGDRVV